VNHSSGDYVLVELLNMSAKKLYGEMTIPELKQELRRRKAKLGGCKKDLIAR